MLGTTDLFVFLLLLGTCIGFGQFRDKLSNGQRVPHPCKPNTYWKGVGHLNAGGGGNRNKFGLDFYQAGYTWTRELCQKDSDGDGETNGYELGDPECVWKVGDLPSRIDDITHPGVCTPFSSETCKGKNDWVDCSAMEFDCPAINSSDTRNITLRMPTTPVPSEVTTYICMVFDVPSDQDYHLIATKAFIANADVMHHMLLFGCDNDEEPLTGKPYRCDMSAGSSCTTMVAGWTVGVVGNCMHENVGILFGKNKYKRMAIQYHWNNPKKADDWTDSSGMTIFYTNRLRSYNGGVLMTGQLFLEIQPGIERTTVASTCSSDCLSSAMSDPIYITSAVNHMHYLGSSQVMELNRNGKLERYITNEPEYSYDSPAFYEYPEPIQVLPTDEIVTTCHFDSRYSKQYVYQGDATADEMCFGFLWYYPVEAMAESYCLSYKSVPVCARKNRTITQDGCFPEAFMASYYNPSKNQMFRDVEDKCRFDGQCHDDCKIAVMEALKHPCLQLGSDIADFTFKHWLSRDAVKPIQFYAKLQKCIIDGIDYLPPSSGGRTLFPFTTSIFLIVMVVVNNIC